MGGGASSPAELWSVSSLLRPVCQCACLANAPASCILLISNLGRREDASKASEVECSFCELSRLCNAEEVCLAVLAVAKALPTQLMQVHRGRGGTHNCRGASFTGTIPIWSEATSTLCGSPSCTGGISPATTGPASFRPPTAQHTSSPNCSLHACMAVCKCE